MPNWAELWADIQKSWEELLAWAGRLLPGKEEAAAEDAKEAGQEPGLHAVDERKGWLRWVVLGALAAAGGTAMLLLSGAPSAAPEQTVYIKVRPGDTARTIAGKLEEHGVIGSRYRFFLTAKLQGSEGQFKAGTYRLHGSMEPTEIIRKLVAGETAAIRFTIPEGFGIKEIAARLAEEGLADEREFLALARRFAPYSYIERNPKARYAAEGFLFPDTYTVENDMDAEELMQMMAENLDERLTPELRERAREQNLSIYDLITLASLVEKEALYDEDRPIIAQVFFKRLEIGMPLQTDATLQYLMDAPKEDVSIADTRMESPYNTYQHMGLPPGPIASPGMAAIEAVLYPADTDYLYFVADRDGHNHYSRTYEEHLAIVDEVR